jgi:hypothetical protein
MAKEISTSKGHAVGASSSLNKSINELIAFTGKTPKITTVKLRPKLHEMFASLAEKWMKKGFNRGHKESLEAYKKTGKVPTKLTYVGDRTLFSGQKKRVNLKSTLKRQKI